MTTAPKRRWFRFSLRTLFLGVTLFGCWFGYELYWIRQRHAFIAAEDSVRERIPAEGLTVAVTYSGAPGKQPLAPSMLWAFGENGFATVFVLADADTVQELTDNDRDRVRQARRLFSEATIKTVHVRLTPTEASAESAIPPEF
jgi:hypothetical protein